MRFGNDAGNVTGIVIIACFTKKVNTLLPAYLKQFFIYANLHEAEAVYPAFELPMQTFMLAIILEMHKKVMKLRIEIENRKMAD